MGRKLGILLMLTAMVTLMTGCWDKMEIKQLVIAVGLGIDKVGNDYLVSVQVVNPNELGVNSKGSGEAPVTVYKGTGKTVFEAIRKLTNTTPRKLYFSHLRIFVVGEETARREGLGKIIEFVSRDHELRADFDIIVAKDLKATTVIESLSVIDKIPAQNLFSTLELSSKQWASTSTVKIDDLIDELMTEGSSLVVTGVRLKGDKPELNKKGIFETTSPPARLEYDGLAVFNKDKLIDWLDKDESKGYNYVQNKVKGTVGTIRCPNQSGRLSIEVLDSKSDIHIRKENEKQHLGIRIRAEGNIDEVQCEIDLMKPGEISELEQFIEEEIKSFIQKALNKEYAIKADLLGLGKRIHQLKPSLWKELKQDWSNHLQEIPVEINVDFKLRETGKTKNSFLDKMKE